MQLSDAVCGPARAASLIRVNAAGQLGQDRKVYDIAVEGVSLVLPYRSEFDRVMGREGVDGPIARLAQRNTAPAPARKG